MRYILSYISPDMRFMVSETEQRYKQIEKLNKLRTMAEMPPIIL